VGHHGALVWIGFGALVAALLVLDLGILNRRSHVLRFKEALIWSACLVGLALLFGLFILWREGTTSALEYYTGYLIVTGARMFGRDDQHIEPERNLVVRAARRVLPITDRFHGQRFFTRTPAGRRVATLLLLVLLVVEWTDLVFAIDSIPAIFAVTRDPFLVYSSNVFAVLGLRALFFILAGIMDRFVYLKPGVAMILIFVGLKMVSGAWIRIPTLLSLGVILGILTIAVVASLVRARRETGIASPSSTDAIR
jgi:predicted tellurium resistance membrane protein TerC